MSLTRTVSQLPALVMALMLGIIFAGIGVYVVTEIGTAGNITVIGDLATALGDWATTWFPIILVVGGASLIISLLVRGFGGR